MLRHSTTCGTALRVLAIVLGLAMAPTTYAQLDANAVGKKLGLAEYYLNSASVSKIEQSDSKQAKSHLARFRTLIDQARDSFSKGEYELASEEISKALQAMSAASAALRQGRQPTNHVATRNRQLRQEIQSYRTSFIHGVREKGPASVGLLDLELLDDLLGRASRHTEVGEHERSRELLDEAYQMTVSAVASLRQNETVVYSLNFQTPADEFRYEDDRYKGYRLLIDQMREQGKDSGQAASLVARFIDQGESLHGAASQLAANGRFDEAIARMEEANRNLARALQSMGLPIPGS